MSSGGSVTSSQFPQLQWGALSCSFSGRESLTFLAFQERGAEPTCNRRAKTIFLTCWSQIVKIIECQAAHLGNTQGLGWGSDRDPHSKKMYSVAREWRGRPVPGAETAFRCSFVKEQQDQEPGGVMKVRGTLWRKRKNPQDKFTTGL